MGGVRLRVTDAPDVRDYFAVMPAQSNDTAAGGYPPPGPYPIVPPGSGLEYAHATRSLIPLADPLVGSETQRGAPWTAFANEWKRVTGREAIIHNMARGGTSQQLAAQPGVDRNWDVAGGAGNSYYQSRTQIDHAIADLDAQPLPWRFAGFLSGQGGSDGQAIDGTPQPFPGASKQGYKDSYIAMVAALRARFGDDLPFFISRLGMQSTGDTTGFAQIRDAQEELAVELANVFVVWRGGIDFPARGLMFDLVHYKQAALEEQGTLVARGVAAAL